MPVPKDPKIYEKAKEIVNERYGTNRSPFRSGAIVQEYKKLGGTYKNDDKEPKLERWFKEKWVNVNPYVGITEDKAYAFFRPTVKISEKTPALITELSKNNLKSLAVKKQKSKYGKDVKDIIEGGMIVQRQPYSKSHLTF